MKYTICNNNSTQVGGYIRAWLESFKKTHLFFGTMSDEHTNTCISYKHEKQTKLTVHDGQANLTIYKDILIMNTSKLEIEACDTVRIETYWVSFSQFLNI